MKIEVLEDRIKSADPETGTHYQLTKGDTITVPDSLGRRWCLLGWVKDVDGVVPTGERVPGARRLDVQPATHKGG